jgi:hypothetical protein
LQSSLSTAGGWYPTATRIGIPAANFSFGRAGRTVRAVVLHIEAGHSVGTIAKFQDPGAQTSAHFEITITGHVNQFVSILDTAYGNGLHFATAPEPWLHWAGAGWYNPRGHKVDPTWPLLTIPVNPNPDTISIEHEGYPDALWTAEMDQANTALLQWIAQQVHLTYVPLQTLIGHCHLDTVDRPNCPGPHVDYAKIAAAANAVPDIWARWGDAFPLPVEQRGNGIPSFWRANTWLGEARSRETFPGAGDVSVCVFQAGYIVYEKATGHCTVQHLESRLA